MGIFVFIIFVILSSFILGKQMEMTEQQRLENISLDDAVIPLPDLPAQ